MLLQAGARGMLARADARRARRLRAAIVIQQNVRMLKARSQYLTVRMAALVIQSAWRGHVARTVAQDIRCEWAFDCCLYVYNVWLHHLPHYSLRLETRQTGEFS